MGGYSLSALLNDIKPYVLNWFAGMGGGTGPFAPTPHALGSTHHSGLLLDAQAPQFLLTSGARALTGHLAVDAGITIDGVDLSAFAGRSVLAGAGLTGGGVLGAGDVTLNAGAGNGISVAADAIAVDQAYSFVWTGAHTFQAAITTRSIVPELTDTYDLGSSLKLWRKGWLSELDAVLFAQNVVTVIGGWLMVSKGEGTAGADIAPADTVVNLGSSAAIAINDFILFRAAGQVEYMQVTAGTGPTWTVTRNLDGSGANTWPAGSVFVNLGYNGTGRIELNANTTPRISIFRQGTTYNTQTELVRIGDMNGAFGVGAELYGFGAGDYAGGNYLKYDTAGGFVVKAGAGAVALDSNGISLLQGSATINKIVWLSGATAMGQVYNYLTGQEAFQQMDALGGSAAGDKATVSLNAITGVPSTAGAGINLTALYNTNANSKISFNVNAVEMAFVGPSGLSVTGGLNLGSTSGAATGEGRASVGWVARIDGSGGGLYAGALSDVQWYRAAADLWRTPDSLTVDGGANLGSQSGAAAGQLKASGTILSSVAVGGPLSTGSAAFAVDAQALNGTGFSLANNATATPFGNSNNFAGLIVVGESTTGTQAMFLTGGAQLVKVAETAANIYTTTAGTTSRINVYLSAGNAVTIQNLTGASITAIWVMAFRDRASS